MDKNISKKIRNFFSSYKIQSYKKGTVLIRAYEKPKDIFFIEEGWVKMYSISRNGDELVLNMFKSYSFFPVSLAINNNENIYYYETSSSAKIRVAPRENVVEFIKNNPDILFNLLQRVYRGLDGILLKMEYAMTNDAKSRLILELIILAKRIGKKNNKRYTLNISVSDLALSIGLARETVSREIKILKNKNLISFENKELTIVDLKNLEDEIA